MSELKTVRNNASVSTFVSGIEDADKRRDVKRLMKLMHRVTGKRARMWGTSIVGYDTYHYRYASGREGDFMITGFSPRKQNLTVYVMPGFSEYKCELNRLGKHKLGKSCLYIKHLSDVDMEVLESIISSSVAEMRNRYPE